MADIKEPLIRAEDLEKFRCLRHEGGLYHDIFISYRVNSEKKLADKLALLLDAYPKLNGQPVRTFLDSNCLLDGGNWEKNFLSALHRSTLIVLLISEAGLDLPSPSGQGLTKIQYADHEQDNCLLEYEYALRLKHEHKADIFVLCVEKDAVLNDKRCKVKFPTSPEGIRNRLAMYENTGEHQHRDGTKGPPVGDTMANLLGLIKPSKKGKLPYFAHIDPDDAATRVPDILRKFAAAEAKLTNYQLAWRYIEDIAYFKIKSAGVLFGMFMPIISLLFLLTVRSARHEAIRFGILIGNGLDLFGLAVFLMWAAMVKLPQGCDYFSTCKSHAEELALEHKRPLTFEHVTQWLQQCSVDVNGAQKTCGINPWYNECAECFCNEYSYWCDELEAERQANLFLALALLVLAGAFLASAYYYTGTSAKKKFSAMFV